jgi:hypothetical protein
MKNFLVKLSGIYTTTVGIIVIVLSIFKISTSSRLSHSFSHDPFVFVAAIAYIILLGFWPIITGVGIVLYKKWGRYSLFVMSVFALFVGLSSLLPLIFAPQSISGINAKPGLSVFEVFISVVNFIFFIVIPVAFLIFFNRKQIKVLFTKKDSGIKKRFRPLGITVVALFLFFTGVSFAIFLFAPNYAKTPLTFIGNLFLSGKLERVYFLVVALVSFYISLGLWRMKKSAWMLCVIFIFISILIGIINTFVIPKIAFFTNLPRIDNSYIVPESLYKLSSVIVILVPIALLFYIISKKHSFRQK